MIFYTFEYDETVQINYNTYFHTLLQMHVICHFKLLT